MNLTEIREEIGEVHGFILVVTGAIPASVARLLGKRITKDISEVLEKIESDTGVRIMSVDLRSENFETYCKEGMPNAGSGVRD